MKMPPRLDALLNKDQALHGRVEQTLASFSTWIDENQLPFFPEYTDHGPKHIESVMCSAEGLLSEASWNVLTAEDAAAMVLSILLHDCAMHLREEGFLALVKGGTTQPIRGKLYDRMENNPWSTLWGDYQREAARFDQDKLQSLFGQPEPVAAPQLDPAHWTKLHRLYIGEFLRRHHARLAHEIALSGVPGPGPKRIGLADGMDKPFVDLVGFIARSHHLDLRFAVDQLPRYARKTCEEVHAPLVMAILRVADYLEIDAPRAPSDLFRVRQLRSPFSLGEWRKHDAIKRVKVDEQDPEALFVEAHPEDIKTFLGIQKLLYGPWGIQKELDASWAVLGEVYGKSVDVGLEIRRIRSTIDDPKEFGKDVEYLPVDARFRVSGGEVLKLLVGPLYGNEPSFGVRELMQNAVDACREREDYEQQNPGKPIDLAELEADVVVFLDEEEDGTGWLTVEDRGIGMTPDVILKYFLTAGASFRNSDAWHQRHDDDQGTPRVLRTGRFGVGVLAAFLVGEEIEVSTRAVGESRGVQFTCRLEESAIELRWCERKVGTTVRVRILKPEVIAALVVGSIKKFESWDWYSLESPELVRKVRLRNSHERPGPHVGPSHGIVNLSRFLVPSAGAQLSVDWVRVSDSRYTDFQWSTLRERRGDLICNGFILSGIGKAQGDRRSAHLWTTLEQGRSVSILRPLVSLFDACAAVPVNIIRTGLVTFRAPWEASLLRSVCRDILGSLLVRVPSVSSAFYGEAPTGPMGKWRREHLCHPLIDSERRRSWSWLWLCREGVGLADAATLDLLVKSHLCIAPVLPAIWRDPIPSWLMASVPDGRVAVPRIEFADFVDNAHFQMHEFSQIWANPHRKKGFAFFGPLALLTSKSKLLILCRELWTSWREANPRPEDIHHAFLGDHWVLEWTGEDKRHLLNLEHLATIVPNGLENPIGIWFDCEAPKEKIPDSPLAKAWKEIIKNPVIPWDLEERRRVLAHAYEELKEEVDRWEKITARERGDQKS